MRTVYGVASGEYSDYTVHSMFERREDAEAHAELRGRDVTYGDSRVEEYHLYEPNEGPERVVIYNFTVRVKPDGSMREQEYTWTEWSDGGSAAPRRPTVTVSNPVHANADIIVRVVAPTAASARKAGRDRAAKVRAQLSEAAPR